MSFVLNTAAVHAMLPHAPTVFAEAIAEHQSDLAEAGILDSVNRCAYLFANVGEESGEFRENIENINYSPGRACAVWPGRFSSIGEVYAKTGSWPGDPAFHTKLMDNVYGNRMGNRPGTHDGSQYIGRGGLQLTGRDEYQAMGHATGLDLVEHPELAMLPENQDKLYAAYVRIRQLNAFADNGNFTGYVRRINGGTIGMSTRQYYLSHITPIVTALSHGVLDSTHSMSALQRDLNQLINANLAVDGKIGQASTAAIRDFQQRNGLLVDGIPGPQTWAAIDLGMRS